jgi:predicted nucleotidyltransferase
MALPEDKINEIINGFIRTLKQQIPVKEVILFGSYANGKAGDHSNIDLAVISNWFEGRPRMENMKYLSKIAATYNCLIEPFLLRKKNIQVWITDRFYPLF